MTNIPKRELSDDILERLFLQLTGVLKIVGQKEESGSFADQFFTKSERIMFAKRLAAILLLDREVPQHVVAEKLSMSPTTVSRFAIGIEKGKYDRILEVVGSKKPRVSKILFEILMENLPGPAGRSRRGYRSMYKDHDYIPKKLRKEHKK